MKSIFIQETTRLADDLPSLSKRVFAARKYVIITQHHYDKGMALAPQLANEEFTKTEGE